MGSGKELGVRLEFEGSLSSLLCDLGSLFSLSLLPLLQNWGDRPFLHRLLQRLNETTETDPRGPSILFHTHFSSSAFLFVRLYLYKTSHSCQ